MKLKEIVNEVIDEIERAVDTHGKIASSHEAYGVLQEEVDEFFDEVRANCAKKQVKELIQVAAVAIRSAYDIAKRNEVIL